MGRQEHRHWARVAWAASMGRDGWISKHVGECSGRFIPRLYCACPNAAYDVLDLKFSVEATPFTTNTQHGVHATPCQHEGEQ